MVLPMPEPTASLFGATDTASRAAAIAAKKMWRDHLGRSGGSAPAIRIGLAAGAPVGYEPPHRSWHNYGHEGPRKFPKQCRYLITREP